MSTTATTLIDLEKERMLGIADSLATAKGAAMGVVRAITTCEMAEHTDTHTDAVLKLRGKLGVARSRYRAAVRNASDLLMSDVREQLSEAGPMFDNRPEL